MNRLLAQVSLLKPKLRSQASRHTTMPVKKNLDGDTVCTTGAALLCDVPLFSFPRKLIK